MSRSSAIVTAFVSSTRYRTAASESAAVASPAHMTPDWLYFIAPQQASFAAATASRKEPDMSGEGLSSCQFSA